MGWRRSVIGVSEALLDLQDYAAHRCDDAPQMCRNRPLHVWRVIAALALNSEGVQILGACGQISEEVRHGFRHASFSAMIL
jgi:hypothetical protein